MGPTVCAQLCILVWAHDSGNHETNEDIGPMGQSWVSSSSCCSKITRNRASTNITTTRASSTKAVFGHVATSITASNIFKSIQPLAVLTSQTQKMRREEKINVRVVHNNYGNRINFWCSCIFIKIKLLLHVRIKCNTQRWYTWPSKPAPDMIMIMIPAPAKYSMASANATIWNHNNTTYVSHAVLATGLLLQLPDCLLHSFV